MLFDLFRMRGMPISMGWFFDKEGSGGAGGTTEDSAEDKTDDKSDESKAGDEKTKAKAKAEEKTFSQAELDQIVKDRLDTALANVKRPGVLLHVFILIPNLSIDLIK